MDSRLINRLLAKLTLAFSASLLIPLLAAILVDKEHIWVFVLSLGISLTIAYLFHSNGAQQQRQRLRVREGVAVIACGWLLVCALGALPYYFFNPSDPLAAVFESVAGFTTTGVTTVESYNDFCASVRVWRCLTHWTGAIGVIMLFILIMPQMNNGMTVLYNSELTGGTCERTLPKIKESAMLVIFIYVLFSLIDFLLLWAAGLPLFQALNMTLATMSTGGFSYYHDSLITFPSLLIEGISLFFMLIASMNFTLYYKIWRGDWEALRRDSEHRYYLGLLAVTALIFFCDLYFSGYMDFQTALHQSIFHAISFGSTTGFGFDAFGKWPVVSQALIFLWMIVGGCSGSTAGGLKITRLVVLVKAGWAELQRTLHPQLVYSIRMGEQELDPRVVGGVTRFFFMYMLSLAVFSVLVSLSGISMLDSIGLIAACLSSVGTSIGAFGPTETYHSLTNWARFVCIWAMLFGRLEFFSLLAIMHPDFWRDKENW